MKISPIHTFQIGNNFPVESDVFGKYPMMIKNGFIVFRVTKSDGKKSYGFLTILNPDNDAMIKPHEQVIPEKVHSKKEEAKSETSFNKPVCLLYEPDEALTRHIISGFEEGQIITHIEEGWTLYEYAISTDAGWAEKLIIRFKDQHSLVIADGHHRTAAYFALRDDGSAEDPGLFSAILSLNQIEVHSYHRKIYLDKKHKGAFFDFLQSHYNIHSYPKREISDWDTVPDPDENSIQMYGWDGLKKLTPASGSPEIRQGSADLLARFETGVLKPYCHQAGTMVYNIVQFISERELHIEELLLDENEYLFLFPPVSREFLWSSSHHGEILPAKSTWIEPRIPSEIIQVPNIL